MARKPRKPKTSAEYRRGKYATLMREKGTPLLVTDEEMEQLRAHVSGLYDLGMSYGQIAAASPKFMHETTPAKVLREWSERVHRDTYNALMATTFVEPTGMRVGRRVDPTGIRRMMQALVAEGFGYNIIGQVMGISGAAVHQLCTRQAPAMASTYSYVTPVYEKLAGKDPFAYGATKLGVTRSKRIARDKGWSPSHCWDPDTISDPCAAPEWTGQCGTVYGFRIHYRDGILPVCRNCSEARRLTRNWPLLATELGVAPAPGTPGRAMPEEDVEAVRAALREGRLSLKKIADTFGCSTRTVIRIREEMSNG